jgi:hypothetical protein
LTTPVVAAVKHDLGLPCVPVASNASIEAALQPLKLFERIGKAGCDVGSRFAVQPLYLD